MKLIAHSDFPPSSVKQILAKWGSDGAGHRVVEFIVEGGEGILLPSLSPASRTDGLWKTTCFELFIKPDDTDRYFEFNFSPSTAWAAYAFEGYRSGMCDLPIEPPRIEGREDGVRVTLDLSSLPEPPWHVGLSAIIQEKDGIKSYWALAHPPGKPDFHHPDCFVLELPAAGQP